MTGPNHAGFKRLSAAEAIRALYVDFEGRKGEPPVLLGVLRRPGRGSTPFVFQEVLDPLFDRFALPSVSLREAVGNVVSRAERGDRRIVSWSEHDLNVVQTLGLEDPGLVARFEAQYANARAVAERWRNIVHGGRKPAEGHLGEYLALIGYPVPAEAEPGHVGETLRIVRSRLEQGLPLTAGHLRRWEALIEHNRHDCAGMRVVCIRAMRESEAYSGG